MRGVGFVLVCGFVCIAACVGGDPSTTSAAPQPDPGVPEGHYKGACTADKKCLEGLTCVQGAVCLYPDDGGPPANVDGGSTTDGSTPSDGGAPVTCPFSGPATADVTCVAASCTGNQKCCIPPSGEAMCNDSCSNPPNSKSVKCDSADECSPNSCCLRLSAPLGPGACPIAVGFDELKETNCGSCGGTNEYRVCHANSDCDQSKKCVSVELGNGGTKLTIGVCF